MNPKKNATFPSSGRELRSAITSYLMLGIALILFRGLITLNILNAFIDVLDTEKNSITPDIAMVKSMTFHASLRYAFSLIIRPIATILMIDSAKKSHVNTYPQVFKVWFQIFSFFESL